MMNLSPCDHHALPRGETSSLVSVLYKIQVLHFGAEMQLLEALGCVGRGSAVL